MAQDQEVRVRIGPKPTFSTEHGVEIDGGRLAVNTVLDVDQDTAKRWIKRGIARVDDGNVFDVADRPGETVAALQAQIAQLQNQIAAANAAGQTAGSVSGQGAANPQPVNAPAYIGRHSYVDSEPNPFDPGASPAPVSQPAPVNDLTAGREAVGEEEDAEDEDGSDDGETPHRARKNAAKAAKRGR